MKLTSVQLLLFLLLLVSGALDKLSVSVAEEVLASAHRSTTAYPLRITGASLLDTPPRFWWKHFMPSFHRTHQEKMNQLTFKDKWNDGSICQPRFFGVYAKNSSDILNEFNEGGFGLIQLIHAKNKLYRNISRIHCYYHTYFGTYMYTQIGYVGVVLYCPVFATMTKLTERVYCKLLPHKMSNAEVFLYPSYVNSSMIALDFPPPPLDKLNISMKSYLHATFSMNNGSVVLPVLKEVNATTNPNLSNSKKEFLACTVQTFQNALTGPQLYLFAYYYSRIGFQVVIYDRYGRHEAYIRELVDSSKVIYHPFTAYQITDPDKFSNTTAYAEGSEFKVFYSRERKNKKIKVASDTRYQDQDKMLTFDGARLQYAEFRLFLAVDSDELLAPSWQSKFSVTDFNNELMKIWSKKALKEQEEIAFYRQSVASVFSTNDTSGDTSHVIKQLSACLTQGFNARKPVEIAACFGFPGKKPDKFVKYIDTKSTCPFHYLHECCDRDWRNDVLKYKKPMDITNKTWLLWSSSRCQCSRMRTFDKRVVLLHLNHNHYLTVNGFKGLNNKHDAKIHATPLVLSLLKYQNTRSIDEISARIRQVMQ